MDLALNNLQMFLIHKTQANKQTYTIMLKLASYDSAVQRFNHYTTTTPCPIVSRFELHLSYYVHFWTYSRERYEFPLPPAIG